MTEFLTAVSAGTGTGAVYALLALGFSALMAKGVIDSEDGTPEMQEIATAVQEGAMAYITRQFRTILMIVIPLCFVVFFTSAEILKDNNDTALSFTQSGLYRTLAFITGVTVTQLPTLTSASEAATCAVMAVLAV